jgi:hypothetical protein
MLINLPEFIFFATQLGVEAFNFDFKIYDIK